MPGTVQPDRYLFGSTADMRQTDGTVDQAVFGWQGGLLYANAAASTAISNTASETAYSTFATIPANTLSAGSVLKIRYQGIHPNTNGTDTIATKLYIATDLTAFDLEIATALPTQLSEGFVKEF